ncbi:MAG: hypothetical protein KGL35_29565, partial [Bradyrhizobium sp.]|nr:hypothetical protein [Bradyrhizobium sp.]
HGRIGTASPADMEAYAAEANRQVAADDPRRQMLDGLGALPGLSTIGGSPLDGLCAACGHMQVIENMEWCTLHGRRTNALDGCGGWQRRRLVAA